MNTKNHKLQVPVSRALLDAINSAAAKDLRTQCAFITKLLQEHPLVCEFLQTEEAKSALTSGNLEAS